MRGVRYKLLRVAVAGACFIAGVCVGYIQRYVQQQRLSAQANQAIELPTSSPASTPVAPAQEEIPDYPEDLEIGPYDIESFIDQHPNANLEPLWQRLKINDDDDPIADFSFSHPCGLCKANAFRFNLDDDSLDEVVLQVKKDFGESYRYLVFKRARDWKFLGHIDVWAKYPPADPVVFLSNGKAWLIVQGTAGTGSGLGAWVDTVYEVSDRGVRRVASYLGEVTQSGFESFPSRDFVARPVSCEIKNGRASLTVSYTVEYFGPLNDDRPLFTKQKKAVLVESSIDATQSEITPHEFETIYNIDSMGPEDFLAYNRAELRAIARGNKSEKKQWLKEFLTTCDNGPIKRELLALIR